MRESWKLPATIQWYSFSDIIAWLSPQFSQLQIIKCVFSPSLLCFFIIIIYLFVCFLFFYFLLYLFIHLFTYLFIHSFIYLFIYSFIYLFIYFIALFAFSKKSCFFGAQMIVAKTSSCYLGISKNSNVYQTNEFQ